MKSIIQAMLEDIYTRAIEITRKKKQILEYDDKNGGSKHEYYIILEQLENILKQYMD